MNPAKRKKLYRLELQKQQQQVVTKPIEVLVKEEKVILKEEVKPVLEQLAVQESTTEVSNLELGLKVSDVSETSENKKDKKKKWSSQDV